MREEMETENIKIKWLPTTHMLADCLTKEAPLGDARLQFLQQVVEGGSYTLGPDPRSPQDTRGRSVAKLFEDAKKDMADVDKKFVNETQAMLCWEELARLAPEVFLVKELARSSSGYLPRHRRQRYQKRRAA